MRGILSEKIWRKYCSSSTKGMRLLEVRTLSTFEFNNLFSSPEFKLRQQCAQCNMVCNLWLSQSLGEVKASGTFFNYPCIACKAKTNFAGIGQIVHKLGNVSHNQSHFDTNKQPLSRVKLWLYPKILSTILFIFMCPKCLF